MFATIIQRTSRDYSSHAWLYKLTSCICSPSASSPVLRHVIPRRTQQHRTMLAVFFTLLPLLTLASAGQLYPPVQVAFSYATPEGQADNHIFTPIPVKISEPGLSYEEDPAMVKAEQAYMMGQYTEQPSVRGVLYFDNNDRPKSFKWSRDQTKYGLKKVRQIH